MVELTCNIQSWVSKFNPAYDFMNVRYSGFQMPIVRCQVTGYKTQGSTVDIGLYGQPSFVSNDMRNTCGFSPFFYAADLGDLRGVAKYVQTHLHQLLRRYQVYMLRGVPYVAKSFIAKANEMIICGRR